MGSEGRKKFIKLFLEFSFEDFQIKKRIEIIYKKFLPLELAILDSL